MAEQDFQYTDTPVTMVGARLAEARKAAGLSLSDLAGSTKIAERYLAAIEEGRFSDLASRTYAVGFARTYARAVGLDEADILRDVRQELAAGEAEERRDKPAAFEPGDPARVPAFGLTGLAVAGALLVVVLVFAFWGSFYSPAAPLPDLIHEEEAVAPPLAASPPAPVQPAASAPVVFTATEPDVWVKFYDASGKQLMQKQMAQGESYIVPSDAQDPQIWTGRPDALQITVGGRPVPPLSGERVTVKDVPVSAGALLKRNAPSADTAGGAPEARAGQAQTAVRAAAPAQQMAAAGASAGAVPMAAPKPSTATGRSPTAAPIPAAPASTVSE